VPSRRYVGEDSTPTKTSINISSSCCTINRQQKYHLKKKSIFSFALFIITTSIAEYKTCCILRNLEGKIEMCDFDWTFSNDK
jgi:hypothetical protein